ncbi:ROK family protein [Oceanobacillus jeddahense]|uniref:ROK family protein n=1 Tax=Oceanobacillus jeddahense TaxID=1462527 RepID=UPI0005960060|nr:ROK family protein [Oceanobacillus jeddahense]
MNKYIAFDIGGTEVKHAVLLEDGTFIEKGKYRTRRSNLNQFLTDIILTIKAYQTNDHISGIAISMPGFVNIKTGYTEDAGAITILNGKNLKTLLETQISCRVEIENDGNCVALAEKFNGNAIDCKDFVCITIGTGIGGGIFLNDRIFHGHQFKAGEIGYMLTPGSRTKDEIWSDNGSTSSLIKSYKQYKGLDKKEAIEGEEIFQEAGSNAEVQLLVEKWLERISFGIFNIAGTLNPEKILIGGGVSAREGFAKRIENHLKQQEEWNFIKVPIETCKHKNDAGMLGALKHFLTQKECVT